MALSTSSFKIDGQASDPVPVLTGVPKASVLGPILFLISEACMGGYLPLSYISPENIPIINFPKYPISLEVNKNIPEIANKNIQIQEVRNIL